MKPCKDALVDAGVIPDDTDAYCTWQLRLLDGPVWPRRWGYRLVLSDQRIDVDAETALLRGTA